MPPPIEGQRSSDRARLGANLIHDVPLLKTMYALGPKNYQQAADKYIDYFAVHCTNTKTGLFPWGEHAFWHLTKDCVGNSYLNVLNSKTVIKTAIHDHLRQVPVWLWEKLYQFNPDCVENFCDSLKYHWVEGGNLEYNRHAPIEIESKSQKRAKSTDFPRHSGFFILDLSFAYSKFKRKDFLEQINTLLDYWWEKRGPSGQLLLVSRPDQEKVNAPCQTLSLAVSLLDAATLLEHMEPKLAATMKERSEIYIDGFLSAPHQIEKGKFVSRCKQKTNEALKTLPYWNSMYGSLPAAYIALLAILAYRFTNKNSLLELAQKAGNFYLQTPFPKKTTVPSMDAGLSLGLMADLYDLTGEAKWIDNGLLLAKKFIDIYMDDLLPRGAATINWYEAQIGTGFLIHGLARIALLAIDKSSCPLDADYTVR